MMPLHHPVPEGHVWQCHTCEKVLTAPDHYWPLWLSGRAFRPLCQHCNRAYEALQGRVS